jgi:hypothetical protein
MGLIRGRKLDLEMSLVQVMLNRNGPVWYNHAVIS